MPDNLKQATKKSIYQNKVAQLDNLGSNSEDFVESTGLVEMILGEFILRVQENINSEKDFVTTGAINEMELKVEDNLVNVYANPHLVFQDRGVNGSIKKPYRTPHSYTDKMPPVQVFKDWIKEKKIRLVNNETYAKFEDKNYERPFKELTEDEKINAAAWGMAKKVFKEGFKPRNIYSKEIPQLIDDLTEQITDFTIQQIIQVVDVKDSAKRVII